jgi:hypothetical protein
MFVIKKFLKNEIKVIKIIFRAESRTRKSSNLDGFRVWRRQLYARDIPEANNFETRSETHKLKAEAGDFFSFGTRCQFKCQTQNWYEY